jgi:hypothetical protein
MQMLWVRQDLLLPHPDDHGMFGLHAEAFMKECARCGSPDTPKQRKLCTLLDCFLTHGHQVIQMTIEEEREFEHSYERTSLRPGGKVVNYD